MCCGGRSFERRKVSIGDDGSTPSESIMPRNYKVGVGAKNTSSQHQPIFLLDCLTEEESKRADFDEGIPQYRQRIFRTSNDFPPLRSHIPTDYERIKKSLPNAQLDQTKTSRAFAINEKIPLGYSKEILRSKIDSTSYAHNLHLKKRYTLLVASHIQIP